MEDDYFSIDAILAENQVDAFVCPEPYASF
jgi:hypothetical protein